MDHQKDATAAIEFDANGKRQTDVGKAKLEEDERAKKRDMFVPVVDMFAEERWVSYFFKYLYNSAHVKASFSLIVIRVTTSPFSFLRYSS